MKSERRHELQKNELADWLGEKIEAVKPHGTAIAIGTVAVAAAIFGSVWFLSGTNRASADSWSKYFSAFNEREPEAELAKVMANQPGSVAALWAAQSVGDMNLARGAALQFSDRAEAEKRLNQAKEAFAQVEAGAGDDRMLLARSQLSQGKLYETLCQPAEALKYYEKAAQTAKGTAIEKVAAESARRMKDEEQVELLNWFAKQTPRRPAPLPGMGGGVPGLPNDLPARPDISLPGGGLSGDLGLGEIGSGAPATPGPAFPAPGETPPAPDATTPPESPAAPDTGTPDAPMPDATPPADAKADDTTGEAAKSDAPKTDSAEPKTDAPQPE